MNSPPTKTNGAEGRKEGRSRWIGEEGRRIVELGRGVVLCGSREDHVHVKQTDLGPVKVTR